MSKRFDALLDFWLKNNMNVLLSGEHGFGKTAAVTSCFERNGLKWKYFSASTMDPWVDLVGVPKDYTDDNGNSYLRLIRPKEFQNDEYDAIFFDEFNRAPKKVRNAVMELIQFKSINGMRFNKLKVVWAAINPDDDEETYDVEKLDPAQLDRFHVKYEVPSAPDKDFFYGKYGVETGKAAIEWWYAIPEKSRKLISGRRLEYILDCYLAGGDIKYLGHPSTNPSKLLMILNSGSLIEKLKSILKAKDESALKEFLKKDNHFEVAVTLMKNDIDAMSAILPLVDEERLMRLTHDIGGVKEFVTSPDNIEKYADMLRAVANSGTLGSNEEAKLRAILSRGVITETNGIVIFEPDEDSATVSKERLFDEVKSLIDIMPHTDSIEIPSIYDFLRRNLQSPENLTQAVNLLYVFFKIIDIETNDNLVTKYPKIIPMINYVLTYLSSIGVDVNDPKIKSQFSRGPRKLRSVVKVQGFLDTYHDSFVVKPRIM